MAKSAKIDFPKTSKMVNPFTHDANLARYLEAVYPGFLKDNQDRLESYGDYVRDELEAQAEYSDRYAQPEAKAVLDNPSNPTGRRNDIILNDRYKSCEQEIYSRGFVADTLKNDKPSPHMLAFLAQYMTSYSDISVGCPLAMTHPIALLLASGKVPQDISQKYLPQFTRIDGKTAIGGTWATEKHGGSDIPATTTTATVQEDGAYRLDGHQWFASAAGFDRWITIKTARTEDGGIGLFLVPKYLNEDWDDEAAQELNPVDISQLKDKMGTKGLPTAEIELSGTTAYQLADGQGGLRMMMEGLGCSRVHNAMAAAGVMHRSYVEAVCWTSTRETFGKNLIEREGIQEDILKLKTEWLAGSALAFESARTFDASLSDKGDKNERAWLRVVTALAKFATAERAVESSALALELVGGLGYTKDHALERIYRDSMVLRVWEGPTHIQARELAGVLAHGGADAFMSRIDTVLDGLRDRAGMKPETTRLTDLAIEMDTSLKAFAAAPEKSELVAHRFLKAMSGVLTYALLCEEAARELDSDKTKQLIARNYHDIHYGDKVPVSLEKSALHEHFTDVVNGKPIMTINAPDATPK